MTKKFEFGISRWENGEKSCTICTKRENPNTNRDTWKVTFSGWNPFPCYSMTTTISVLFSWLIANGWKMKTGGTRIRKEIVIDDQTGEVVSEKEIRTSWIPVNNL